MLKSLNNHSDCVITLALCESNNYLLTGSTDRTIIIWEISNDYKLSEILRGHQDSINSIVIYQETIISASSDKSIKFWSRNELTSEIRAHKQRIKTMCVLSDGLIVSGSDDFSIKIWKQTNKTLELIASLMDHQRIILALECLSNQSFVSSSQDKTVRLWRKSDKNFFECVSVTNLSLNIEILSLTVLENLIISGESHGIINVLNGSSLEFLSNFSGHNDIVWSLVSINNQSFASSSQDTTIKVWIKDKNSYSFKCTHKLTEHASPVWALAVLKEKYLISGSEDGSIKIWHLMDFNLEKNLKEHQNAISGLAVFENNFISVSTDIITIWDGNSLTKQKTLLDIDESLSVVALFNDSFAVGNSNGSIRIWSYFKEHRVLKTLTDNDQVFALKVLNKSLLFSASRNGKISLWNNTMKTNEIQAHKKPVLALNVFPNGSVISCSADKNIKIWYTEQYSLEKTIP
jgi:WD40 repeat protein